MTRSKSSMSFTSRTSGSPGRMSVWVKVGVPVFGSTVEAFCRRTCRNALPSTGTWRPLVPTNAFVTAIDHGGRPYVPTPIGAGPNSKTTRSNPGLWAARIAVTWACAASLPPFWAGQLSATVVLGATVGLGLVEDVAVGVGDGRAIDGLGVGDAGTVEAGTNTCGAQADAKTSTLRSTRARKRRSHELMASNTT